MKIGWLCTDCWEIHTNENHIECSGKINKNPTYGFGCDNCGFVHPKLLDAEECCKDVKLRTQIKRS